MAEAAAKVELVEVVVIMEDINVQVGSVIVNTAGVMVMVVQVALEVLAVEVDEEMDIIGTAVIIGG